MKATRLKLTRTGALWSHGKGPNISRTSTSAMESRKIIQRGTKAAATSSGRKKRDASGTFGPSERSQIVRTATVMAQIDRTTGGCGGKPGR